jgi:hypothetical protein
MASLRLVPVSGDPIEVTRDQSLVGRDPSCEIVVTDGSVSRRHARLEKRGGAWFVVDQGSANGTYINSLKVAEHPLKNGQELRFGALAFRVDLREDLEATMAAPLAPEQTVMAPPLPPPLPPSRPPTAGTPTPPRAAPSPPPPRPTVPPPTRAAAAPPRPPAAPSAAAARERIRPAGTPPVPPMSGGPPPAKKGRGPLFWVGIGCCGCVLLVALLVAVLGGGAFFMTKGAADAAHAWLAEVRQGQLDAAYNEGLSSTYRSQLTREDFETLAGRLRQGKDATFWQRSIDNDRAVLKGILSTESGRRPITLKLVKEGGAWKIDEVDLGAE